MYAVSVKPSLLAEATRRDLSLAAKCIRINAGLSVIVFIPNCALMPSAGT